MLKEASRLYRMGFAIHLIKPKSKMPVKAGWTTGPRAKWQEILDDYRKGMNVGVRLGKASRVQNGYLAVIDCDVKSTDPKDLEGMEAALKELTHFKGKKIKTPIVASGRGGGSCHIYVVTPTPQKPFRFTQSPKKVKVFMPSVNATASEKKTLSVQDISEGYRLRAAWEISIMGEGQQVVLPPSIHPDSGKAYKWLSTYEDAGQFAEMTFEGAGKEAIEKEYLEDFKAEDVDLIFSDLPDETIDLIVEGKDCADRSAALFVVSKEMLRHGFTKNQVLSVLTNRDYYLGQCAYDHAKTESRKRAAQWVNNFTFKKAKKQALLQEEFDAEVIETTLSDEQATEQEKEFLSAVDWKTLIQRNKQDGAPKNTFHNIRLILRETMGRKPFIAHNEFSVEDTWLIDTPWGSKRGQVVRDTDTVMIKEWLSKNFRMEPGREKIEEVLIWASIENQFHPVRDFLNSLEWDGVKRVDTWLSTYLRAQGPKDYLRVVGRKTLLGMVGRIYDPGCKFDNVLILEGDQGVGKSTTARILAGDEWFSDSDLNIGDKDAVVNMQGVWVYELGELSAMSRFDVRRLKEFVSRKTDKIRPPYGKRTISYPRQSIFIGTTNDDEYLKDKTGNRRYWPVRVGKVKMRLLEADREQLLAEAAQLYLLGENLWIENKNIEAVVKHEQGLRVEHDELEDQLREFIVDPSEVFPIDSFRTSDLFEHAPCLAGLKKDRQTEMRVAAALKAAGYEKRLKREAGKVGRFWMPKKDVTTSAK